MGFCQCQGPPHPGRSDQIQTFFPSRQHLSIVGNSKEKPRQLYQGVSERKSARGGRSVCCHARSRKRPASAAPERERERARAHAATGVGEGEGWTVQCSSHELGILAVAPASTPLAASDWLALTPQLQIAAMCDSMVKRCAHLPSPGTRNSSSVPHYLRHVHVAHITASD